MQPPQITDKPAFSVIGCQTPFISALSPDANNLKVLGALWQQFVQRAKEVPNRIGHDMYGIIFAKPEEERTHPHEIQYIAGVSVSRIVDVPEGMVSFTVPATTYAVFIHQGPIGTITASVHHIYRVWLPQSPYEHAGLADIELYDQRFKLNRDDSEMEYWIPVKISQKQVAK